MSDEPRSTPEDSRRQDEAESRLRMLVLDLADYVLDEGDVYELLEKKQEEREAIRLEEGSPERDGVQS